MITHVFSQIFLHFNWHTSNDQPMLVRAVEPYVYNYIRNRIKQTRGVYFHEIGGTDDHTHLAVRIEPFVLISEFIGELKGAASCEANKHFKRKVLEWQRGYGVVSFNKRQLAWICNYIRNQRVHHAAKTTKDILERYDDFEEQLPKAGSKPANNH